MPEPPISASAEAATTSLVQVNTLLANEQDVEIPVSDIPMPDVATDLGETIPPMDDISTMAQEEVNIPPSDIVP